MELFERAAYYGTFIALTLYLTRVVGLDDANAGWIGGLFGALIYLFPFFTGAIADRIGFRNALILAFALLTTGYAMLGAFHVLSPVLMALFLIVLGGSFVKPIITGTVSKSSDETNRARAFSLFYMVVNIGAFTGKTVVKGVRQDHGRGQRPVLFRRRRRHRPGAGDPVLLAQGPGRRPSPQPGRNGTGHDRRPEQLPVPGADPDHRRVLGDPGPVVRLHAEVRAAAGR